MGLLSRVKTWIANETLTSSDLNAEFNNIINNLTPNYVEDISGDVSAMQATADPYPGATESLATTLTGEIQRLRYMIKQITGEAQYYIDPDTDIATIVSTYPSKAGIQSGSYIYAATSGTDTYTASLTPTLSAYTTGMTINVLFGNANATTTPTLQIGSLAAITIKKLTPAGATTDLVAGDIIANHKGVLWHDGTYFILLNPATVNWASLPNGTVIQVAHNQTGASATTSTVMPLDDTIPQNSEGGEFITQAITPKSATNILIIEICAYLSGQNNIAICGALFQDSTADALAAGTLYPNDSVAWIMQPFVLRYKMTAGTTSETTFKFRAGNATTGTITLNGTNGSRRFGGVCTSTITITEIKA